MRAASSVRSCQVVRGHILGNFHGYPLETAHVAHGAAHALRSNNGARPNATKTQTGGGLPQGGGAGALGNFEEASLLAV